MRGHVILSHGSDSGPDATKVSALARVAESLGWTTSRPDYREEDQLGYAGCVPPRVARLVEAMQGQSRPLVLAGSSMGAFVSGLASLRAPCDGLFLVALPTMIPECPQPFDMAAGVPATLVHGFADELCPADSVVDFARRRGTHLLMVADSHRLADHVDWIAGQFGLFLEHLSAAAA